MILDGEQRLALEAILAEKANGEWAGFEAAVIAARQNLKTYLLEVVVLADLFLFGSNLVIWTAHLFPTTMEAFRDLKRIIDSNDHLRRRVKRISEANGEESIELVSSQRLLFRARSKGGGRGLTGDRVILDEAFALGASEMGSLLPTMSARPNPQVVYASSAGKTDSHVLRGVRDRGRSGGDPSLVYVEWCAPVVACPDDRCDHRPGALGCALDDVDAWRQANPALGRRITVEHIEAERRALPPEEFARERLGWWEEPPGGVAGLPLNLWEASTMLDAPGGLLALSVDVTPDLAFASIGRATAVPAGICLDLAAHRRGTAWVTAEVARLRGDSAVPVALDLGGPAAVLNSELGQLDNPIGTVNPATADVAHACSALLDGLIRRRVWHADNQFLDVAVRGASRRPLGDGAWAWSRKNSLVDISPLVAATLALWGATRVEEKSEPLLAWR
jgi:phage terminase large subunit-like protein